MDKNDLIINYFENKLTQEELAMFTKLMQEDDEFAQEVHFQKKVKKAIILQERKKLKKELFKFEKPKKKSFLPYLSVAASLIVSLGIGLYFLTQSDDSETLYKEYYQTYPNVISPTVRGDQEIDKKAEAFNEYDSGNYEKALLLFTVLYEQDKEEYALFYKTLSLVELKRYKEAQKSFETINLANNTSFTPYIKWYMALNYLKLNKKEKAISLLTSLSKTDNPQQKMAKDLLKKLE